jgi:hypothetical protein
MGANNVKLNIEFIRAEFKKEGYELLTTVYEGAHQKLELICPRGHTWFVSWNNWQQNIRCPCFSNTMKLNIEFIRAEFAKEGYILLTEVYENNKQKLEYKCPMDHYHSITWGHWNSKEKRRCPYCYGNARLTIEHIRAKFKKEGYTLLTTVYEGNKQKLEYICSRGHRHSIGWNSWNSKNKYRCPFCKDSHVSKWEKTIRQFLGSLHVFYMPNDKTQLTNPKTNHSLELDMWFPQLNKAIECNGVYWHKKKKQNDKIKKQLCKDQGINLLVITDKEWKDNTDKCKNKIQEFLC